MPRFSVRSARHDTCSCYVPVLEGAGKQREEIMDDRPLDRQDAVLLALGWLTALWVTLS